MLRADPHSSWCVCARARNIEELFFRMDTVFDIYIYIYIYSWGDIYIYIYIYIYILGVSGITHAGSGGGREGG